MKPSCFAAVLCSLAATVPFVRMQDPPPAASPCRVGVYDSRGIAIAYAASKHNEAFHAEIRAQMDQAKGAGDEKRVREIEAQMQERQREFHVMGFSRSDVSTLLEPILVELPAVADAAGVDLIVNKWDVDYVRDGANLVNVTEAIVNLYGPNERTMRWVREVQSKEPLPPEQLDHDH